MSVNIGLNMLIGKGTLPTNTTSLFLIDNGFVCGFNNLCLAKYFPFFTAAVK